MLVLVSLILQDTTSVLVEVNAKPCSFIYISTLIHLSSNIPFIQYI